LVWTRRANGRKTDAKEDTQEQDARYKEENTSRKRWIDDVEQDGSEKMENEGSRSTEMEEGYYRGQGPSWTVAPMNE
jgi:hypothetical protein